MSDYLPPDAKKVLILAPHPDDETLGCGGTIALYTARDVEVYLLIISDGKGISLESIDEDIDIVSIRRQESIDAASILGIKHVLFLDFPSQQLESYKNKIKERIEDVIKKFKPDILFAPSPLDFHQDHITIAHIALWLKKIFIPLRIAFYEIYNTIRFNSLVDITDVMHIKEKAMLNYRYSLLLRPEIFYNAIKALNSYRSFYTGQNRFYEAYWIISEPKESHEIIEWFTFGMENIHSSTPENTVKGSSRIKEISPPKGIHLRNIYELIVSKTKVLIKYLCYML